MKSSKVNQEQLNLLQNCWDCTLLHETGYRYNIHAKPFVTRKHSFKRHAVQCCHYYLYGHLRDSDDLVYACLWNMLSDNMRNTP